VQHAFYVAGVGCLIYSKMNQLLLRAHPFGVVAQSGGCAEKLLRIPHAT
jgi:hypothetical protein